MYIYIEIDIYRPFWKRGQFELFIGHHVFIYIYIYILVYHGMIIFIKVKLENIIMVFIKAGLRRTTPNLCLFDFGNEQFP